MVKKLKIAVFYSLPIGGEIKALHDNLKFLKTKGHDVDVYTLDIYTDDSNKSYAPLKDFVDNYYIFSVKRSRIRKITINTLNRIVPMINIPSNSEAYLRFNDLKKTQKEIACEINAKDYDIVLIGKEATFTKSPVILKYINKPTIYFCQDPIRTEKILEKIDIRQKTIFSKLYSKFVWQKYIDLDAEYAQYADKILVNSYYSHETLLRTYGLNSEVSYLGIDTNLFKCEKLPRENFILSVGIMAPLKGFDFIIKSISNIDEKIRPKLVLTCYASLPAWKEYIIQLADVNKVKLEILENIDYNQLVELYNKTKLFVFGSYLEPFGLVSLESMSCGTPVVGVKEGGIREIIQHENTGFLVDRNEKKFAEAISRLLINEDIWNKFSENGPGYVNDYWTIEQSGQRLLEHICELLDEQF